MRSSITPRKKQRGAVLVLVTASMVALLSFAALAIDGGYMYVTKTKLQQAADAAALAGASQLPDLNKVVTEAQAYAAKNMAPEAHGEILSAADIVIGNWDSSTRTFTAGGSPSNAVRVVTQRSATNGNPLSLFLAGIVNHDQVDVTASATATFASSVVSRFIIDEEMIDSDIPVIEDLADREGKDSDDLISDRNNDWFIDIPAGSTLVLPTGQVGDEGLFDTWENGFPFANTATPCDYTDKYSPSPPTMCEFNKYNEDSSSWRYDLIKKKKLDPLVGVDPVNDPDDYDAFVDGNVHVSPVYKSDISELNKVKGKPAVNALGERRGILAYKIIGVVAKCPTSYLPCLRIEIVAPSEVNGMGFTGASLQLVD